MTEPEVSLLIALYYIKNRKTNKTVKVSIDGAHIKTKDTIHFDINSFISGHDLIKLDSDVDCWQGVYKLDGYDAEIEITSVSGIGDVISSLLMEESII